MTHWAWCILYDILNAIEDSLINHDLYVSVDGDNNNEGTSITSPFKTINYALQRIYSDSLNIHTIHVAPGTYSPSTNGEVFPISSVDFINLSGIDQNTTILDAQSSGGVIELNNSSYNPIIENFTGKAKTLLVKQ